MKQTPTKISTTLRPSVLAAALATVGISAGLSTLFFYANASVAAPLTEDGLGVFSEIYEPSGVSQLADGRVLIVEDEVHRAINVLTLASDGSLIEDNVANEQLTNSFGNKLSDLEGITTDSRGFVYAATSHSTLKKNRRDPDREQLLRFKVQGNKATDIAKLTTLRDDLEESEKLVNQIKAYSGSKPDFDDLDIEGLTYNDNTKHLMLGLRAPMADDKSMIIAITNSDEVFDKGAKPNFGSPIFLDLDDGGIRSLHFNPALNKYIIANEVENNKGKNRSKIWTWSGRPNDSAMLMDLPELEDLRNIEGITSVTINGNPKLLFTPDEGVEKKEKPAKYRYIDQARFR